MELSCEARRVRGGWAPCRAQGCCDPAYSCIEVDGTSTSPIHLCLVHTADLYEALGDTLLDTSGPL